MTTTSIERPVTTTPPRLERARTGRLSDPVFQAYVILRAAFVTAPIVFGIDKFFNWMTQWQKYLWAGFANHLPGTPHQIMMGVGVLEITAGILVLLLPRVAPYVVAAWLGGIVTDLVIKSAAVGGHTQVFWDIALRDFGLMLGALALARLAAAFTPPLFSGRRRSASAQGENG
jgi:uncharacterized membrane protein YphA (DoxX/SURF4 family)